MGTLSPSVPVSRTQRSLHRPALGLVAVVVIAGCAAASCGSAEPTSAPPPSATPQQCVQAVFDALTGMITEPRRDQPFEEFVTRFGTASPAYAAYQDSFGQFYGAAVSHGVRAAENNVRVTVNRDCAAS
jgi:hypothetical protein